jgi:hypothetical protein
MLSRNTRLAWHGWIECRYVRIPKAFGAQLQPRYCQLVEEHLSPADRLAAGLRALPTVTKGFAAVQAAWRFYANPRVTLPGLARPLVIAGRKAVAEACQDFVLVVHDWSNLHFNMHTSKKDRVSLSRSKDLGYELQSVLLVGDRSGDPLAMISMDLRAADGVHGSRQNSVRPPRSPLDELAPAMEFVEEQELGKPALHIIDAEADSVGHFRQWVRTPGRYFLVRADDTRIVEHEGEDRSVEQVRQKLREAGQFRDCREVLYHGRQARQYVAEVPVILTRPAYPRRKDKSKPTTVPGPPLPLRLVMSEVHDKNGKVLAVWFLLTNVPENVAAETVALWYYWRWRTESYFKLLKSAGQQVEQWQQEDADAIAKRLLVASMACVIVWQLMRSSAPEADEVRELLVRLSGRQMKRTRPYTAPALLAGLWVLLSMLYVLDHYHVDELRRLAAIVFPPARAGP